MLVHPNFMDEPAASMARYPKQDKDETVFDFSLRFEDFLLLQAFTMNIVYDFGKLHDDCPRSRQGEKY